MKNLVVPGLTPHDLEERKNYICASDIAKIMGTCPPSWGTAMNVYLDKCEEMDPITPSKAMLWGSLMEDDIITYTEATLREFLNDPALKATRQGIRRKAANGVMSCTLDAVIRQRHEIIEAKTHASIHGRVDLSGWGEEPFTDQIPPYYLDQVMGQFLCAPEMVRAWVPLSVGRMEPTIYCVERAKHLGRLHEVEDACCNFWDYHIVNRIPPNVAPSMEAARRIATPTQSEMAVALSDAPLERSKAIAAQITALEKEKDTVDAGIRTALVGAIRGLSPRGHQVFLSTYNRKGYTVAPKTISRINITLAY